MVVFHLLVMYLLSLTSVKCAETTGEVFNILSDPEQDEPSSMTIPSSGRWQNFRRGQFRTPQVRQPEPSPWTRLAKVATPKGNSFVNHARRYSSSSTASSSSRNAPNQFVVPKAPSPVDRPRERGSSRIQDRTVTMMMLPPVTRVKGRSEHEAATIDILPRLGDEQLSGSESSDDERLFNGHSSFTNEISGAAASSSSRSGQSTLEKLPPISWVRLSSESLASPSFGTFDDLEAVSEQDSASIESDEDSEDLQEGSLKQETLLYPPTALSTPKNELVQDSYENQTPLFHRFPFEPDRRISTTLNPMNKS